MNKKINLLCALALCSASSGCIHTKNERKAEIEEIRKIEVPASPVYTILPQHSKVNYVGAHIETHKEFNLYSVDLPNGSYSLLCNCSTDKPSWINNLKLHYYMGTTNRGLGTWIDVDEDCKTDAWKATLKKELEWKIANNEINSPGMIYNIGN